VGGLSRRAFLARAALVAAAISMPLDAMTEMVSVAEGGRDEPPGETSTLSRTIVRSLGTGSFSHLAWGPGEPFILRDDLARLVATPDRTGRRSLAYFSHMSDAHVVDTESPSRLEIVELGWLLGSGGMLRPQEAMSAHVLDATVAAANRSSVSPVTGAPLGFGIHTGDNTDNGSSHELATFIGVLDGATVTPSTGRPGVYEGVQAWPECWWAYHPEPGIADAYSDLGWPRFAGMLDAAQRPFQATGSAVPWFTVLGNHDVTWFGTVRNSWVRDLLDASGRKIVGPSGLAWATFMNLVPDSRAPSGAAHYWEDRGSGRTVTPDAAARRRVPPAETVRMLLESPNTPGPTGHGFSRGDLSAGRTWWQHEVGPLLLLGLDTTNHYTGSEGSVIEPQFRWLEERLIAASRSYYGTDGSETINTSGRDKLVVVCSHHDSISLTNTFFDPEQPFTRRLAGDLMDLLLRFPNVVAWVNGHSHHSRVVPHKPPPGRRGGFWEFTSASCIDFPQQGRMVDLVDNRDGSLSIFTWVLDHGGDATPGVDYTPQGLASISRTLAANDPFQMRKGTVWDLRGTAEDRNVECLLAAPFDLSLVSDGELEAARLASWGRLGRQREQQSSRDRI